MMYRNLSHVSISFKFIGIFTQIISYERQPYKFSVCWVPLMMMFKDIWPTSLGFGKVGDFFQLFLMYDGGQKYIPISKKLDMNYLILRFLDISPFSFSFMVKIFFFPLSYFFYFLIFNKKLDPIYDVSWFKTQLFLPLIFFEFSQVFEWTEPKALGPSFEPIRTCFTYFMGLLDIFCVVTPVLGCENQCSLDQFYGLQRPRFPRQPRFWRPTVKIGLADNFGHRVIIVHAVCCIPRSRLVQQNSLVPR